ncbi:regulatory protein GemA [Shinella sp. BYT-45]|uniref:regulatory protein GemA n=1 Tax=Shinella sp. BYT-45 TaxID=3377377 RepID=UPI00397FC26A
MTSTIAAIHVGFKQLGIAEDEDKRAIYSRVTGKNRLSLMKPAEKDAVLAELRRLGFSAVPRRSNGRQQLTGKFAKKLQALWIGAWNLGLVEDRDDAALIAFVKRQTGLDQVRFLHHADDARAVVEALKAWMAREAGVNWSPPDKRSAAYLGRYGYKIAWAQWRILHPGADRIVRKGFDTFVVDVTGTTDLWSEISDEQWQAVMNALGPRVRAARKAVKA